MSKDKSEPAFPLLETGQTGERVGMTKRELYALHAMQGLLSNPEVISKQWMVGKVAEMAFIHADAMLLEGAK